LRREVVAVSVFEMKVKPVKPRYFGTPSAFRAWLAEHHSTYSELLVGFHRAGSGTPSITWPESVDEALCVGWIDGVRKRVDETRYTIRFTPRKETSTWSAINIAKMQDLIRRGRVLPAGLKAFEKRTEKRSRTYSYEQRASARLDGAGEKRFRSHPSAWEYFQSRPPWYRRTATWWVVSAKKEETRARRLKLLIECSAKSKPLPGLKQSKKSG
jgi:uncharacterized protein YdeI (YjbR/CyaY-like superfamily)